MTENQKLRALLAEARETLSLHEGVVECDHPECRLYRFFAKGIDAALAEPAVWCARCEVLEQALRASCGPGCSHEGESHEPQRSIDYHAGWAALGDDKCGYCGKQHDAALALAKPVSKISDREKVRLILDAAVSPKWLDNEPWHAKALARLGDLAERNEVKPGTAITVLVEKLERERDEARAEVAYWKGEFSRLHEEHLPVAFAGAYRRGAEAMREAAVSCVGSDTALLQTYRSVLEGRIRALPVPEDDR